MWTGTIEVPVLPEELFHWLFINLHTSTDVQVVGNKNVDENYIKIGFFLEQKTKIF